MASRIICSFRFTKEMHRFISDIMNERQLDRTSVLKLALYQFSAYMSKEESKMLTLAQLVETLERHAPDGFPDFASFGDS